MSPANHGITMLLILLLLYIPFLINGSFTDYPSANASRSWLNHPFSDGGSWKFIGDGTELRPVLTIGRNGYPDFGFGFFFNGTENVFFLVLVKMPRRNGSVFNGSDVDPPPIFVWSANGDRPVGENATLELTPNGLVLKDADGTPVWPALASQSQPTVTSINLDAGGNLKLINGENNVVWDSFGNPTNVWLPGQRLIIGQSLQSRSSESSFADGFFFLSIRRNAIRAYIKPRNMQIYATLFRFGRQNTSFPFTIGSLNRSGDHITYQSSIDDFQFMRLDPNGHLNVFQLVNGFNQTFSTDLLRNSTYGDCAYPTVCGKYGVCNKEQECTCAGEVERNTTFFRRLNRSDPSLGCAEITPLSCQNAHLHTFFNLPTTTYFRFDITFSKIDLVECQKACLSNCSCKAVIFRYRNDLSVGECYFPVEIFSFIATSKDDSGFNFLTSIKVQPPRDSPARRKSSLVLFVAPSVLAGLLFIVIFIGTPYYFLVRRKRKTKIMEREAEGEGDRSSVHISVLLKKFTFEFLISATQNFQIQLGKGGFGSVFEGKLENGTKIAVKRLENPVKKEFMAEVKTIGSVHHFNLVKLLGYCAENSNRLLVYEYMCNGSLEKWIFPQNGAQALGWKIRREMIVGIAKGLEYLHVHCNPNIIHFDIKPQNILLDKDFNVKISDFGLAKWIERDQTHVYTLAKGTPGYIAPELIRGRNVSVKVDVYSFGIVMMEIICGRKNSKPFDGEFLIESVKRKAEEGKLVDLVDDRNGEMEENKEEAAKTMEVAIWCLRPYSSRPSMAMVVKVLEGLIEMEPVNDFGFLTMFCEDSLSPGEVNGDDWTPLVASTLSGPR